MSFSMSKNHLKPTRNYLTSTWVSCSINTKYEPKDSELELIGMLSQYGVMHKYGSRVKKES